MPRLDEENFQGNIGGTGFGYSGTRIERLDASEYTLAAILADDTGSLDGFGDMMRELVAGSAEALCYSPRKENLLLRVAKFSTRYNKGVDEIHGFKPVLSIDPKNDYPVFDTDGLTPLYDAAFSAVGSMNAYAEELNKNYYTANGIAIIITDGGDNRSTATMKMVRDEIKKAVSGEILESMITVLIGINAKQCKDDLEKFKDEVGIDFYIDAGDFTPSRLAKIVGWISQSVNSQAQAKGTGGPSQNVNATI